MVKIRLQRIGRRNHAEFRVVATEHTRGPKSAYLEMLGTHNPHRNVTTLDGERIKKWIAKGAQVSDTVHNLLVTHGVIEAKKRNVLPRKQPPVKEAAAEAEPAAQEQATDEAQPADAGSAESAETHSAAESDAEETAPDAAATETPEEKEQEKAVS